MSELTLDRIQNLAVGPALDALTAKSLGKPWDISDGTCYSGVLPDSMHPRMFHPSSEDSPDIHTVLHRLGTKAVVEFALAEGHWYIRLRGHDVLFLGESVAHVACLALVHFSFIEQADELQKSWPLIQDRLRF